jgi:hypothetical protein
MSSAGGRPSGQTTVSVRTSIVPPGPRPPPADTPHAPPVVTTSQVKDSLHDFAVPLGLSPPGTGSTGTFTDDGLIVAQGRAVMLLLNLDMSWQDCEVTVYQLYPSSGRSAGPLRPPAPALVLTAVKLMYAGAAVSAVELIIGLALIIVDIKAAVRGRFFGHSLTGSQVRPLIITVWIVFGLVVIVLWLGMARANGQGRNWARILSTVLFVLATLQLRGAFTRPVSHAGFGVTMLYCGAAVLFVAAWLVGAAAVWLLWRPASRAFFQPQDFTQAGSGARLSSRI